MLIGHMIAVGICLSSPSEDEMAWIGVPGLIVGLGMFVGGLNMRMLRSRGWAQLGVIAGFLPVSPGSLITIPISIWAMKELNRDEVRRAFIQHRRERTQGRRDSSLALRDAPPRFSRRASRRCPVGRTVCAGRSGNSHSGEGGQNSSCE